LRGDTIFRTARTKQPGSGWRRHADAPISVRSAAIRAATPEGRMVQTQSAATRGTASNFKAMKRGFFGPLPELR